MPTLASAATLTLPGVGSAAAPGASEVREPLAGGRHTAQAVSDVGERRVSPDDDFPALVLPVARTVARGAADRVAVMGDRGVGAGVLTHAPPGVRAALLHETVAADQGREDKDLNVLGRGGLGRRGARRGTAHEFARRVVQRRRASSAPPGGTVETCGPGEARMNERQNFPPRPIVLLRHGESVWNRDNRFSGWTDVDLSAHGREEARAAGRSLNERGLAFDVAFTSVLKRAMRTLWLVLDEMDLMWLPVQRDWRLNERHYGARQGLNQSATAQRYGEAQVKAWRRSYDVRPPALGVDDPRHPGHEPRYRQLRPEQLPASECLKDTVARFLPCWHECIAPAIRAGQSVLIAGHGNSLRVLGKYLDDVSDAAIVELNIPTGVPLVYELNAALQPLRHYYLGEAARVQAARPAVACQASVKRHRTRPERARAAPPGADWLNTRQK